MIRRGLLLFAIVIVQFVVLEAALRAYGEYAGATTFGELFMDDPDVGIRLRPGASIRYTTVEFTTDIQVNPQGVRDDEPIGPKAPGEKRIVVLGDSLVLSVQVDAARTFCEQLEARLNAADGGARWRVINAGVQGYGTAGAPDEVAGMGGHHKSGLLRSAQVVASSMSRRDFGLVWQPTCNGQV